VNICLFLPSFLPEVGGLEKSADKLALTLSSLDHKVLVFTQRPRKVLGVMERPYPIIYYKRPRSTTWFPFAVCYALEQLHREFDFDLICAYQAYLPGYIAVRFGRKHNIPVVISSRGGDISERSRYLKRWISRKRIMWALRHADAVTTLNKHLAQRAKILTDNSVNAHVIHNGVEIIEGNPFRDAAPADFAHLQKRTFILTLGRLRRFKGLDLLLNAIKLLKDQNKAVPLLVIAGDGPEKNNLIEQVDENNISNCVEFAGEVEGSKKAWLLANCTFFVQPSRGGEGMPNSVLEAMSYSKPVLGTTVGGLLEIVTNGENGLLVKPDSPSSLAEGLEKMLRVDQAAYAQNAKRIALEHSWDNITKCYLDLYHSLLRL